MLNNHYHKYNYTIILIYDKFVRVLNENKCFNNMPV